MQVPWTTSVDELGPGKVLFLRDAQVGLEGIVVVDNVACGPAIGGVRIAPDITADEVVRLARAMPLKNVAAGLPHGRGKADIVADPGMNAREKESLIRSFGRDIRELNEYTPGRDMGTADLYGLA